MQTRALLGTVAIIVGLLWLGALLLASSDYTMQSVIAELSFYVRPAQEEALAATLKGLTLKSSVPGPFVTTGTLL